MAIRGIEEARRRHAELARSLQQGMKSAAERTGFDAVRTIVRDDRSKSEPGPSGTTRVSGNLATAYAHKSEAISGGGVRLRLGFLGPAVKDYWLKWEGALDDPGRPAGGSLRSRFDRTREKFMAEITKATRAVLR